MPKHFEFVLAAYGIWIITFVVYFAYLYRKARVAQRVLDRLGGRQEGPPPA